MRRWIEYLPDAVVVAGLTAFLVDETDAATSAFRSSTAVVLMGAATAAWLVARLALPRLVRSAAARAALFTVAAAAVLAVVVLPAYDDETVVEAFPVAAPAPEPTADDPPGPTTTAVSSTAPTTTAPAPERTGSLQGIDHRAAGTVNLYRTGGRWVVGLEEIDIQPGPDYDVYVVPGDGREDLADGSVRLDDLRGNRGTQFYDVPADVDLATGAWTVLVWCETFDVPIAASTPA